MKQGCIFTASLTFPTVLCNAVILFHDGYEMHLTSSLPGHAVVKYPNAMLCLVLNIYIFSPSVIELGLPQ